MVILSLIILAALLIGCCWRLTSRRQATQRVAEQQALLDALPEALLLLDSDGRIRLHNAAAVQLLGNPTLPLQGEPLQRWLPQFSASAATSSQQLILAENPQHRLELSRVPAANCGSAIVLRLANTLQVNPSEDAERFKRSQYFASIGTWDWAIDTDQLFWSEAIYAMFGFQPGEITPSYALFCTCVHPDDREQVRRGELRCIETGQNHDEEYRVVWPDGSVHWLRETGNVVKDASGQAIKMMGVVRDITEEKACASQLEQLARHDPLTGLPNRLLLEEHLAQALLRARVSETRVALVFIDLNGFKQINDAFGHTVGDKLLIHTAQRLQQKLRESDLVARLGGDEFVLIIEGLTQSKGLDAEAQLISQKIFQQLAQPIQLDTASHQVDASIGIAIFPDHGPTSDSLIHIADQAMYAAKRSGNNQYRLGPNAQ